MSDASTIRIPLGISIERAARQLVAEATSRGLPVEATFNGIRLVAEPSDTPGDICRAYSDESDRRCEEWRRSPEGRAAQRRDEQEVVTLASRRRTLMLHLDTLDFADLDAVIGWLRDLQPVSDRIGVGVTARDIVATFGLHGFRAGENTGEAYDDDDRENVARYLIGQALDCLQSLGMIHPIFCSKADEWREKFRQAGTP